MTEVIRLGYDLLIRKLALKYCWMKGTKMPHGMKVSFAWQRKTVIASIDPTRNSRRIAFGT
jgi:hypothetical protein